MAESLTTEGIDGATFTAVWYGSLGEAIAYHAMRLHGRAFKNATQDERRRALWTATQIVDALNFKGCKAAVHALGECASSEAIRAAEDSQVLEFPRGTDTEEPRAIRMAVYEIAESLLDGKVPEEELEALGITSAGYSSVRTTYNRNQVPIEHLINGVPNQAAWRLIRPFLRDGDSIKLSRV